MQRSRLIFAFYLGILAAWMQVVAPVAVAAAASSADPFAIICSHAAPTIDGSQPDQGQHDRGKTGHGCCLLCCGHAAGLDTGLAQPAFTALDYPSISPLRWRLTVTTSAPAPRPRQHPPRGPPSLV